MPETNRDRRTVTGLSELVAWYRVLLRNRDFATCAAYSVCVMGIFYAFVSGTPYIMVEDMDRSATEFGFWLILVAGGYILGSVFAARTAVRITTTSALTVAAALSLSALAAMMGLRILDASAPWTLFIPASVVAFAAGLALPRASATATAAVPQCTRTASGLLGFLNLIGGAAIAQSLGVNEVGMEQLLLATMMALNLAALGLLLFRVTDLS